MNKAYKYRIYPTEEQSVFFKKTFGCCRYIYNNALSWRITAYRADGTSLTYKDTALALTQIKHSPETSFLKEADSIALQQSLRNLDTAFKNFWKNRETGFPGFKSKHRSRLSYTIPVTNNNVRVMEGHIRLPKAGEVRAKIHRTAPWGWKLKSATVSLDSDGKYYVSILYEYNKNIEEVSVNPDRCLGLDYKSDSLYVDSEGNKADMPHYYRLSQNKLAKAQRKLRNKVTGSSNYQKQQRKISVIYSHISNQRKDFLHKRSAGITNRYDLVCVEDLSLKSIASHRGYKLGKATNDNGYGMFLSMLEYKLHDRGKKLIRIDRYFPSSRKCQCGYINPDTKDLSLRYVTCPVCNRTYDRDINAAVNIRNEGYRMYLESV